MTPTRGTHCAATNRRTDGDDALDRRYVVALVCVRPLTGAERDSEPYTDGGPPIGAVEGLSR